VKFSDFTDITLKAAHQQIIKGGLLGKTLQLAKLDFSKNYLGTFEVVIPGWLQKEFSTEETVALALYSRIVVKQPDAPSGVETYAELLEIIPPGIREHFENKAPRQHILEAGIHSLCNFGELEIHNPRSMKRCVIVGAGPGGIVMVKELLEQGIESVICLEQSAELGGIFSRGYDNLTLTSSVIFSMFSDFWVGEGKDHHFWSKDEAVEYWTSYAKHYGVLDHIRFGTKVESITESANGSWNLRLDSGETLECDHLILAIGNNNIPRYPEWSSQLSEIPFTHSRDFKNAEPYKGKRVLVVGGGESGSDVAYEISQVASQTWVSLRESSGWIVPRRRGEHAADISTHRGIWDLPREYGKILSPYVLKLERARKDPVFDALAELNEKIKAERGIWGIFGTKTLALPKAIAHHGCKVIGDISRVEAGGRKLVSVLGETIEDLDAIVFCTGYQNRVDFMPEDLQRTDPRQMYKHMFHPDYGKKIAWIGWARPGFGSQFPIMEMQARYAALIFNEKMSLPAAIDMHATIEADFKIYREQFEENADRIRSLVDYHRYMNGMARILGCYPPLMEYFITRPRLWLHLMYGPTQATQFRLRGPGKKVKLAHEIIRKLPVSTFNHIVKAGLRGRVRYGLRSLTPKFIRAKA
jgi:dimethylaniline monooxygenase (N-oxide forming)